MNDPRLEESAEPRFLGSDCCQEEINTIDDVPTCSFCNEPCEELYETREEAQQRHDDEPSWTEQSLSEERYQRNKEDLED